MQTEKPKVLSAEQMRGMTVYEILRYFGMDPNRRPNVDPEIDEMTNRLDEIVISRRGGL